MKTPPPEDSAPKPPKKTKPPKRAARSPVGGGTSALILGCVLLAIVFVTLCKVDPPSVKLGKCLSFFLALGAALLSYLITGKLAVALQQQGKSAEENARMNLKVAGTGGFAVFVLFGMLYDPLDARPFLAQWGFINPDADVAKGQQVLQANTDYVPKVKGVADGAYVRKVAEIQREKGLPATGVLDARTLSMIDHVERGTPIVYRGVDTFLSIDGSGGSVAEDPSWIHYTPLKDVNGKDLDARIVPIVTVPMDSIGERKINLGDFAIVYDARTKAQAFAVVGDLGPRVLPRGMPPRPDRFHYQISPAVVNALGLPLRKPSQATYQVAIVVFAQSALAKSEEKKTVPTNDEIARECARLLKNWGGLEKHEEELQ